VTNDSGWLPLSHDEVLLEDDDEVLFRQIRFGYLDAGGALDSRVFTPKPEDKGQLSVHRASKVTAEEAADQYAGDHDEPSIGFAKVTVRDVHWVGLRVIDDSDVERVPKGHAYIDFRSLNKSQAKKRAQQLRTIAKDSNSIVVWGKSFEAGYKRQGAQGSFPF